MIIVSEKRRNKVNLQRPCTVISLGQQIRQGIIKPSSPVMDGSSEEVTSDNLRIYNNMEKLSRSVTVYDSIAARDAATHKPSPEPSSEPSPEPSQE